MTEPEGLLRDASAPRAWRLETLAEPMSVRKVWAGRSRAKAVYVELVTRDGDNLAEVYHVDRDGRMQPGPVFSIAIARFPELSATLIAAHRRAVELALIDRRGQDR
jgi:hypothetical protein